MQGVCTVTVPFVEKTRNVITKIPRRRKINKDLLLVLKTKAETIGVLL